MKVGIMQPYFFPYIGYWQLINAVEKYVIFDDVNYIKGGWINRNHILMNGESKLISIRLHNASQNKLINQVEVVDDHIYINKLLKSLESNYRKAPCFSNAFPIIKNVIKQDETNLSQYLKFAIEEVCKYLSINTEILVSSNIKKNAELRGQDKIIEICKELGADKYINAIGGQKLYTQRAFKTEGIELKFLKTGDIKYNQYKNEFIPNLSIIDVMMFNEPKEIITMLNNYELL